MTSLPMIMEGLVACLLLVTVVYCALLERRIRTFRNGQESLRHLVAELDAATHRAEAAVGGLAATTREAEGALEDRLREARSLSRTLALGNRARAPRRQGQAS
jgi:cytochrome c biogenesis protein ResB